MDLDLDIFMKILYALGIGVLIGLERAMLVPAKEPDTPPEPGSAEAEPEQDTLIGVRTFSILSLGGFCAAMMGGDYPMASAAIVAGLVVLVVVMYYRTSGEDPGVTTEVSAVAACGLGFLCWTHPHSAGVLALLITALLSSKRFLNVTLKRLKRVELTDTIKFLAIILIVLPLLPNKTIGPYDVFNPYKVMYLVILISGIGFVGYFLTKFLGAERGLGLTGLVGGLTSSTAVTAAMADQAKQSPNLINACAFAAIIANATMFLRVLVVVGILDQQLVKQLAWSIGTMTLVAAVAVVVLWLQSRRQKSGDQDEASGELAVKNPFSLGPALKFAGFFVGILFVAKIAKEYLGDSGLYLAAMASGLADVDAITLSITEQTKAGSLELEVGAIGVTIAVVANSIVKSGIAVYSGGMKFGLRVGAILLGATGAGLAVLLGLRFI